jgi:hypothetical protein
MTFSGMIGPIMKEDEAEAIEQAMPDGVAVH